VTKIIATLIKVRQVLLGNLRPGNLLKLTAPHVTKSGLVEQI
jgi:hypothetical protein